MPQRFLRPGITNSDNWNRCAWDTQSFYLRILTLVDDFGRYDGRVAILHAYCFALRPEVKPKRVAEMRNELISEKLIDVYMIDGKEYLQVLRWKERARSDKSQYPDPQDSAAERSGAQDSAASLVPRSSFILPSFSVPAAASAALRAKFEKWMVTRKALGKKPKDWAAMFAEQFEWLQAFTEADQLSILTYSIMNNYQGLQPPKSNGSNGSRPHFLTTKEREERKKRIEKLKGDCRRMKEACVDNFTLKERPFDEEERKLYTEMSKELDSLRDG
jgi:hypothetical protein